MNEVGDVYLTKKLNMIQRCLVHSFDHKMGFLYLITPFTSYQLRIGSGRQFT